MDSEHGVQWSVGASADRVVGVVKWSRGNEHAMVRLDV